MFWQIVLFILIVFFGAMLRGTSKGYIESLEKEGHKLETSSLVVSVILGFVIGIGVIFYIPFALQYSLEFLLDYSIDYWTLFGLLVTYSFLIKKL